MRRILPGGAAAFARAFGDYAGAGGAFALAASVVASLCEGAGLLLFAPLLALVTGAGLGGRLGALFRPLTEVAGPLYGFGIVALMTGFLGLRALVIRQRDRRLARLLVGFVEDLREKLTGALATASWPVLARLRHARISQLLGGELHRCGAAAQHLTQGLTLLILLLVQLGAALLLSPALTAAASGLALLTALLLWPFSGGARDLGDRVTAGNLELAERVARFMGGLKFTLAHDGQANFTDLSGEASRRLTEAQIVFQDRQSLTRIVLSTASAVLAGGVFLVGHYGLHTSAPVLLALMALFSRLIGPAAQLQQTLQMYLHAFPAWEAVDGVLTELATAAPVPPALARPRQAGEDGPQVVFRAVTYRYPPNGPGIGPIDLEIAPRGITGLTGPSGAGKTTLADLLTGLITPDSGEILVNGEGLDAGALPVWRARLAYTPQDGVLFNDTLRSNLLWGAPEADSADLERALDLVGAGPLLRSLPDGLETVVGERGVRFSGGERQRLGLARALLRSPAMLILDEATSALPPEDEQAILRAIRAAWPRQTVLMVSHRPSALTLCDAVVRLETWPR